MYILSLTDFMKGVQTFNSSQIQLLGSGPQVSYVDIHNQLWVNHTQVPHSFTSISSLKTNYQGILLISSQQVWWKPWSGKFQQICTQASEISLGQTHGLIRNSQNQIFYFDFIQCIYLMNGSQIGSALARSCVLDLIGKFWIIHSSHQRTCLPIQVTRFGYWTDQPDQDYLCYLTPDQHLHIVSLKWLDHRPILSPEHSRPWPTPISKILLRKDEVWILNGSEVTQLRGEMNHIHFQKVWLPKLVGPSLQLSFMSGSPCLLT